jgi:predicted nuclease with TOPRIM domain
MIAGIAGAGIYVTKLRSDNAILKANQIQLEQSIESQKAVLEQAKEDYKSILEANKKMNETNNILKAEYRALDKRFNKNGRDLGYLATKRTKAVEKIINRASVNAQRCVEIAMGSPLTEKELNATKKSEINSECPSLANPKFVTH